MHASHQSPPLPDGQALGLSSSSHSSDMAIERERLDLEKRKLDLEERKLDLDRYKVRLERHKVSSDAQKPSRDAIIKFADVGIRSLLILNGGAALSLLAFVGNSSRSASLANWAAVFAWFASGAALSVVCAGLSYLAQVVSLESPRRWPGPYFQITRRVAFDRLRIIALLTAALGMLAFCVGLFKAHTAISISASTQRGKEPLILRQSPDKSI